MESLDQLAETERSGKEVKAWRLGSPRHGNQASAGTI